jgi:hypothetical protein
VPEGVIVAVGPVAGPDAGALPLPNWYRLYSFISAMRFAP